jgi:hypothetical protein
VHSKRESKRDAMSLYSAHGNDFFDRENFDTGINFSSNKNNNKLYDNDNVN